MAEASDLYTREEVEQMMRRRWASFRFALANAIGEHFNEEHVPLIVELLREESHGPDPRSALADALQRKMRRWRRADAELELGDTKEASVVPSNVVKDAFVAVMREAGFQRKGDSWFDETDDAVLVANLQKSNYGAQYYLNLGVWLKGLAGRVRFPKEQQCHIRVRASALDAEHQEYWDREVFNLDHDAFSDEARFELIRSFVETKALPFLVAASSLPSLRRLLREKRLDAAAVTIGAQRMLQP